LLPWDQIAYWAVTVGANMVGAVPIVGDEIRLLLLGGHSIDGNALVRFYVLHCVVLPMVLAIGVGLHIWRVRKDGGIHLPPLPVDAPSTSASLAKDSMGPPTPSAVSEWMEPTDDPPPSMAADPTWTESVRFTVVQDEDDRLLPDVGDEPMVMTFPHLLLRELVAFLALTVTLSVLSLLFDAPLEGIADPTRTPNPAKAPWYFLGLQELLRYYPPVVAGVLMPTLTIAALAVIPYFRVNIERPAFGESARLGRLALLWLAIAAISVVFRIGATDMVWAIQVPLWLVGTTMSASALPWGGSRAGTWLRTRSLPFWIFAWFLISALALTVTGGLFRGPNWRFTLPWRDGIS
jgi:quinol-cytochrome oxidoreductase complex cytochrome b subunit